MQHKPVILMTDLVNPIDFSISLTSYSSISWDKDKAAKRFNECEKYSALSPHI